MILLRVAAMTGFAILLTSMTASAQGISRPAAGPGIVLPVQYYDRDRDRDRDRDYDRDRRPAFHCEAELRTSEGPRRMFCDIRPQPVDTRCECPTPRPPRGYPPYPPAFGHAVP